MSFEPHFRDGLENQFSEDGTVSPSTRTVRVMVVDGASYLQKALDQLDDASSCFPDQRPFEKTLGLPFVVGRSSQHPVGLRRTSAEGSGLSTEINKVSPRVFRNSPSLRSACFSWVQPSSPLHSHLNRGREHIGSPVPTGY